MFRLVPKVNGASNIWQAAPEQLGFRWQDTVYTNALLLCSKDALSLKKRAQESAIGSLDRLIEKSMSFFENVTVPLCKPELIIAYSNVTE